ncbi:MAG: ABC transporter permease [Candidatus Bathyarchaeota archaeon]|nr:ABC transporter permease [Candidatus Bathyarchaeota archaeon]
MKRNRLSQIFAGVLVNAIYEMKNYPIVLLSTVISPLSLLAVITFVSSGTLLGTAIQGGLIMIFFSSGIALQSDLSHLKNDFKLQDMIVSSPTSSKLYMGGMALAEIVYSIPGLAILIILAGIYLQPSPIQILILTTVLFVMFVVSVAIGFMLSTFSSDVVQSYAFSRLLSLLFAALPPVYYPISYVPAPFNYLAYLSPTTYAAEIMHSATGYLDIPLSRIIVDWAVLLGVGAIILLVAIKKSRWKDV